MAFTGGRRGWVLLGMTGQWACSGIRAIGGRGCGTCRGAGARARRRRGRRSGARCRRRSGWRSTARGVCGRAQRESRVEPGTAVGLVLRLGGGGRWTGGLLSATRGKAWAPDGARQGWRGWSGLVPAQQGAAGAVWRWRGRGGLRWREANWDVGVTGAGCAGMQPGPTRCVRAVRGSGGPAWILASLIARRVLRWRVTWGSGPRVAHAGSERPYLAADGGRAPSKTAMWSGMRRSDEGERGCGSGATVASWTGAEAGWETKR